MTAHRFSSLYAPAVLLIAADILISVAIKAQLPVSSGATFAIRNVRIFDGSAVLNRGTVVFADGKIQAAGASVAIPKGASVIDGSGKTLLPGLIDAHVHMADSYSAAGDLPLEQAAVYGITTVLDMGTSNPTDFQAFKNKVKAYEFPQGADFFTAGPPATAPGGHGDMRHMNPTLTSPVQAQAWVDERVATGSNYIKIISETFEEHARKVPTLSYETIAAVIKAAHSHGLLAVAHTLQQARAKKVVEAGIDGLVHISPYDPPEEDFGKFLAAHHVFQSTNLISYAPVSYKAELASDSDLAPFMPKFMIDDLSDSRPFPDAHHEYSIAALRLLKAAGVPVLAGTDIGYPYAPLLHAELEIMVHDGGLTPLEALKAATSVTADIYNLKDRGRIKPGLRADLLLVEGNPTEAILSTRKIAAVWARGVKIDRASYQAKLADMKAPARPPMGGPPPGAPAGVPPPAPR